MSEPLDVDSGLIQLPNEWCFINGPIIRLPAGGQAPSIFPPWKSNNDGRITHLEEQRHLSGPHLTLISYRSVACTNTTLDARDKQVIHVCINHKEGKLLVLNDKELNKQSQTSSLWLSCIHSTLTVTQFRQSWPPDKDKFGDLLKLKT